MRSLTGALRSAENVGEALPVVWPELMQAGVEFRRGQTSVIASAPGVGKSLMANILSFRARVPTLYLSADTDADAVSTRLAAHITKRPIGDLHGSVRTDAELQAKLKSLDWIRWYFEPNMSIDDIALHVEAFNVMYGEPPWLIVVDNLSSMTSEEGNPYLAHRYNVEMLNTLARESGACVLILHHLTGFYEPGTVPPDLGALEGKVAKMPALVLGLFNGMSGDLGVTITKNRYGPADPGGRLRIYLRADKARVQIGH